METKHSPKLNKSLFEADEDNKFFHFLQALPYLDFTPTGLANIAKRFGITAEELQERINEYQAQEGRRNG